VTRTPPRPNARRIERHICQAEVGPPDGQDYLILKRASASCPSGECNDDDFDVLADGAVVGRIMKAARVAAVILREA
jgi:hypothetical protein